jgi:hypothetical protein
VELVDVGVDGRNPAMDGVRNLVDPGRGGLGDREGLLLEGVLEVEDPLVGVVEARDVLMELG